MVAHPALALGLTVAVSVAAAELAPIPGAATRACPDTRGQRLVERMNAVRAERSLPALAVDLRLVRAADVHARDMAGNGVFGHVGSHGSEPADRVTDAGYEWTFVGENVAAGLLDPVRVLGGWMDSRAHRRNVLAERATQVGVGFAEAEDSEWGTYWVAVYGATDGELRPPEGGCHP